MNKTAITDRQILNQILQIIENYCDANYLSLGQFAENAGVSKAWISRLNNEDNKHVSVDVAIKLLDTAGYEIKISKGSRLNKKKLTKITKK